MDHDDILDEIEISDEDDVVAEPTAPEPPPNLVAIINGYVNRGVLVCPMPLVSTRSEVAQVVRQFRGAGWLVYHIVRSRSPLQVVELAYPESSGR